MSHHGLCFVLITLGKTSFNKIFTGYGRLLRRPANSATPPTILELGNTFCVITAATGRHYFREPYAFLFFIRKINFFYDGFIMMYLKHWRHRGSSQQHRSALPWIHPNSLRTSAVCNATNAAGLVPVKEFISSGSMASLPKNGTGYRARVVRHA